MSERNTTSNDNDNNDIPEKNNKNKNNNHVDSNNTLSIIIPSPSSLSSSSFSSLKEEQNATTLQQQQKQQNSSRNNNNHHLLLSIQNFICPICLSILHQPSVNTVCGHVFCFTCFHSSMDMNMNSMNSSSLVETTTRYSSKCPTCRCDYNQLCAPCKSLEMILWKFFPKEMQMRKKEEEEEESLRLEGELIKQEEEEDGVITTIDDTNILNCVECNTLVQHPIVPPCGHLVCRDCILVSDYYYYNDNDCHYPPPHPDADDKHNHSCCYNQKRRKRRKRRSCPKCYTPIRTSTTTELKSCTLLNSILTEIISKNRNDTKATKKRHDENVFKIGRKDNNHHKQRQHETMNEHFLKNGTNEPSSSPLPPLSIPTCPFIYENEEEEEEEENDNKYIHYMIVCNGCGMYPIRGRIAYTCQDCSSLSSSSSSPSSSKNGFNLCQDCYIHQPLVPKNGIFHHPTTHDTKTHRMVLRKTTGLFSFHESLSTTEDVIGFILRFLISFIGGSWRFVLEEEEEEDSEDDEEEESEEEEQEEEEVVNIIEGNDNDDNGDDDDGLYYWQSWWFIWRQGSAVA